MILHTLPSYLIAFDANPILECFPEDFDPLLRHFLAQLDLSAISTGVNAYSEVICDSTVVTLTTLDLFPMKYVRIVIMFQGPHLNMLLYLTVITFDNNLLKLLKIYYTAGLLVSLFLLACF